MIDNKENIRSILATIYPAEKNETIYTAIQQLVQDFKRTSNLSASVEISRPRFSEKDIILICYGDHLQEPDQLPLTTLYTFLQDHLAGLVNSVHILPFFPYSSDDGFSVINYRKVATDLGDWKEINEISKNFKLMVDFVLNHISTKSEWFQNFLINNPPFIEYFITVDPALDLSNVVRPRSTALLSPFQTATWNKYLWTTFNSDQVDLNYQNPQVLIEMIDILLFYVKQGAQIIRLDAIAYLWKSPGTNCINLPQTHQIVKILRSVLDQIAPGIALVTETNVPHNENISYFGEYNPDLKSSDEAQLVYQFPLAPLILNAFLNGNSNKLLKWVEELPALQEGSVFLNFTASHDGIGIRPVEQILSPEETHKLVSSILEHGGQVSTKSNSDGTNSVYELNATWYDAINVLSTPDDELCIERFIASQVIMLSLAGVPGIYFSSLFGARNCIDCFEKTGRQRSINREKYNLTTLNNKLGNPNSVFAKIFKRYKKLLTIRSTSDAFDPNADQKVIWVNNSIFSILRQSKTGEYILCLVNLTEKHQQVKLSLTNLKLFGKTIWTDKISSKTHSVENDYLDVVLSPYQSFWLHSS